MAVRLALLGAGIFMIEQHLPAINTMIGQKTVEVRAVYSRTEANAAMLAEKLSSKGEHFQIYSGDEENIKELLRRDDIDAVDIVLPINSLAPVVQLCLAHGKHVISEKPIAPSVQMGKALVSLYELKYADKLVWSVAENFRHIPSFRKAAEIIREGRLGKVIAGHLDVRNGIQQDNKYFNTAWRKDPQYQGGFLLDGGVHFTAMIRAIMGDIKEVSAHVTQIQPHLPPADTISGSLKFANGAVATCMITFAMSQSSPLALNVYGEKGSLRITRDDVELTETTKEGTITTKPLLKANESVKEEISCFVDAVRGVISSSSSKVQLLNTPQEALNDLAVIEALLESGKNGKVVTVGKA
eukprot:TRINITY_DN9893_c0_g1_i1.p1 TRINITY_DN9893_c0_g1~~TRINITY_DN9893_c0_g1_i1.p1  ORF type:complete len:374 (+),score=51.29 TRINITY_DN9893_c0_g1_i1:60-1124(+)